MYEFGKIIPVPDGIIPDYLEDVATNSTFYGVTVSPRKLALSGFLSIALIIPETIDWDINPSLHFKVPNGLLIHGSASVSPLIYSFEIEYYEDEIDYIKNPIDFPEKGKLRNFMKKATANG